MRSSDLNAKRKLDYGKFTLLGGELRSIMPDRTGLLADRTGLLSPRWYITLPNDKLPQGEFGPHGYVAGPFRRRWEAVESGLRMMGIE